MGYAAGKLDRPITLQRPNCFTQSATSGTKIPVWEDVDDVWAAIEPVNSKEVLVAKSFSASTSHKVTIRYRTDVLPTWRVKYGTRYFSIDGPPLNALERGETLQMFCTEVVPK